MSSLETRSSSALFKRAEQLKRWEESETNRELTVPNNKTRKIQFSAGCVFLAACAAGDKDEVQRLLQKGADIDTANVDGLTALHQACIDDDLDMVEFLVAQGSDVNRGDNEGWTPLHATASCGFLSIARYLIEHGGNVAAVNNDAELPHDIADTDEMEEMLQKIIATKGIDADEARNKEERLMLMDAKEWLNGSDMEDLPHPKTGATALHVAAAKGYIKVMSVLLQGREDINIQDFDGWTPLHAAAHWGQREACEILVEHFCDMDVKNFVGQTAFDVADTEMVRFLEELKKKQATLAKDRGDINSILQKSGGNSQKRRSSITRMSVADKSNLINKDASAERQLRDRTITEESSNKVKKVEVEIRAEPEVEEPAVKNGGQVDEDEDSSESSESTDDSETTDSETNNNDDDITVDEEKKNRVNADEPPTRILSSPTETVRPVPTSPPRAVPEEDDATLPSWRRPGSVRLRGQDEPPSKVRAGDKDAEATTPPKVNAVDTNEVPLRRTHSFESDEKFYRRYKELHARIKAGSCPALHTNNTAVPPARSMSLRERHNTRPRGIREDPKHETPTSPVATTTAGTTTVTTSPSKVATGSPTSTSPLPTSQVRSISYDTEPSATAPTTPTTPGGSKLSPGNIFKNFFKSFVPPVRDEESETQRKAHAKRVRETRRSTQGVTLEEIKSAEQLVKKKNQQQLSEATQQLNNNDQPATTNPSTSITATITTATPTTAVVANDGDEVPSFQERRPSWRLRVDNGDKSKFLLEDARNHNASSQADSTTSFVRRTPGANTRPSSATLDATPADSTVTLALRKAKTLEDEKEQDKENDSRTALATQAVIQRRRRPKRRSTGVVHVDMDEIDPERQDLPLKVEDDTAKINTDESGGDWSTRSSRINSVSSSGGGGDTVPNSRVVKTSENGELDYKKLYEESTVENDRLRVTLKKTDKELAETKSQLAKATAESSKSSLSEMEKRERRAMERKLSEMEEELKFLEQLKSENQRLKDENGALIRVISKLSK